MIDNEDVHELLGSPDEIALKYKSVCEWADLPALEVNLWLLEAYRVLVAGVQRVLGSVEAGMTSPRFHALRDLYLTPGHRLMQADIQRRGKTTSGSVTRLMDALEQEGLVVRLPNISDRRTTYVELTEKGLEVCGRLIPAVASYSMAICEGLDMPSRKAFVGLLKALSDGAEQAMTNSATQPQK